MNTFKSLFDRTMNNCKYYEENMQKNHLLNEIGVLRGIAYCLEEQGESVNDNQDFLHFIDIQNKTLANIFKP